jgi:hypothetical protein
MFWSNLPESVTAQQIAELYRRRWSIEGMFQRLVAILESEIESLGSPKAALLEFTTAVLAYNVLALLKRSVEQAHRDTQPEGWEASSYHLAVQVRSSYEGMQIALPPEYLPVIPLEKLAQRLLELARNIQPKQVAKSPAAPRCPSPRHGSKAQRGMRMFQRTASSRLPKRKDLERDGCKSGTVSSHYRKNEYVH